MTLFSGARTSVTARCGRRWRRAEGAGWPCCVSAGAHQRLRAAALNVASYPPPNTSLKTLYVNRSQFRKTHLPNRCAPVYNERTMNNETRIRVATPDDAPALLNIYLPYVRTTAITFELTDPTLEDFTGRIRKTLERYPYLVAEYNGSIIGYAYVSAFRPRAAYAHAVETSIYMDMTQRGKGMGRRLYEALAQVLLLQNVYNMEACIAHADPEDEFVPSTSRLFHNKLGFRLVGTFMNVGYKFNRWYDMIWMERVLADHPQDAEDFIPFPEISQEKVAQILANA